MLPSSDCRHGARPSSARAPLGDELEERHVAGARDYEGAVVDACQACEDAGFCTDGVHPFHQKLLHIKCNQLNITALVLFSSKHTPQPQSLVIVRSPPLMHALCMQL
jgi:hypothetical protein